MRAKVDDFATDTCQARKSPRHLLHQLVALQLPNWQEVLPFITHDQTAINYRAPGVLENYAHENAFTFEELQTMIPEELVWDHTLLSHFATYTGVPKSVAGAVFFCAGRYHDPDFKTALARAMEADDEHKIEPVMEMIQGFVHDNKTVDSAAVAKLIRDLDYPDMEVEVQEEKEEKYVKKQPSNFVSVPKKVQARWSFDVEKQWNKLPEIQQIKAARNLTSASYCYPLVLELLAEGYRDSHEIVDAVDMLTDKDVAALCGTTQLKKYRKQHYLSTTSRELVKTFLRARQEPLDPEVRKVFQSASFVK